jgi:hypothetical protein
VMTAETLSPPGHPFLVEAKPGVVPTHERDAAQPERGCGDRKGRAHGNSSARPGPSRVDPRVRSARRPGGTLVEAS